MSGTPEGGHECQPNQQTSQQTGEVIWNCCQHNQWVGRQTWMCGQVGSTFGMFACYVGIVIYREPRPPKYIIINVLFLSWSLSVFNYRFWPSFFQKLQKQIRGILNKLTPQKFEKLLQQILDLPIHTEDQLREMVNLVFEKVRTHYELICVFWQFDVGFFKYR